MENGWEVYGIGEYLSWKHYIQGYTFANISINLFYDRYDRYGFDRHDVSVSNYLIYL